MMPSIMRFLRSSVLWGLSLPKMRLDGTTCENVLTTDLEAARCATDRAFRQ
jgi:hypothetical protein